MILIFLLIFYFKRTPEAPPEAPEAPPEALEAPPEAPQTPPEAPQAPLEAPQAQPEVLADPQPPGELELQP